MKLLTIIRHAKSDWGDPELSDFERPLNKRGKKDLKIMSEPLSKIHKPDIIISSGAMRAKTTIEGVCESLNFKKKDITFDEKLYLPSHSMFEMVICSVDDKYQSLFLCSHNPGTTYFINQLTDAKIMNVPTLGVAQMQLDIDSWSDIFSAKGKLLFYDFPKNHK